MYGENCNETITLCTWRKKLDICGIKLYFKIQLNTCFFFHFDKYEYLIITNPLI